MQADQLKFIRHELKTALNHVTGYSEIILEDVEDTALAMIQPRLKDVIDTAYIIRDRIDVFFRFHNFTDTVIEKINDEVLKPLYKITQIIHTTLKLPELLEYPLCEQDLTKIMKSCNTMNEILLKVIKHTAPEDVIDKAFFEHGNPKTALSLNEQVDGERSGAILIVDDDYMNRDLISRQLQRIGYDTYSVTSGPEALDYLKQQLCDLIILDIMMPEMSGYTVLEHLKKDLRLADIPVIVISALDNIESITRCIELGAEDYLSKTFEPVFLKARVNASVEKKKLHDKEKEYLSALIQSQELLENELAEAAEYVRSLIPEPLLESCFKTEWQFIPSTQLGGDCFGYHFIDEDNFAFYLLDVSGHGIGAALLSVSVINVIRTQAIKNTNFLEPSKVIAALNENFQMEKQNNMYFTIWYGVYNIQRQQIKYSSAGAPPCLIYRHGRFFELETGDMIVGIEHGLGYSQKEFLVEKHDQLFLFSDGLYEIRQKNGELLDFTEFEKILKGQAAGDTGSLNEMLFTLKERNRRNYFEDDVSILKIKF